MSDAQPQRNWIYAGKLSEFPVGAIVARELGGHSLIVINSGGQYHCFTDKCGHQPVKLSEFGEMLEGGILICQAHGACFSVSETGKALCFPAQQDLTSWETRIDGDNLLLSL